MSAQLKSNKIYCPECGSLIKKGYPACSNCKFKVQVSRQANLEKEDIPPPREPAFKEEELKKLSSVSVKSTAGKEAPKKIQVEKTDEPEEIKEKQGETGHVKTSFDKEMKAFERLPESQDDPIEPEKAVENTLERPGTEEKKAQDK